jgi:hypothetical protein
MQLKNFKKISSFFFILAIFCLAFFIPRYFENNTYDAMEDELLSIDFNTIYSTEELLKAPDKAHPPLWYVLMEIPTKILGIDHGIFYYRLIQSLILFSFSIFSFFYFQKKIPSKTVYVFFSLFLSNIYLIHLTSQHRMYAMVIGIAIFYSLYWYQLIKINKDQSFKSFVLLGFIAALGFLTNYSIVWLLPIWPLSYLIYRRDGYALKRLLVFVATFLLLISWFIPTFISQTTSFANQSNITLNLINIAKLFGNYFGILPIFDLKRVNFLFLPFIILLYILFFWQKNRKKSSYFKAILISTLLMFFCFLVVVKITGSRLFYTRVSIAIIMAFYVLIADSFNKVKYSKKIVCLLIIIQLSQFIYYFFPYRRFSIGYDLFNYRLNPIGHFREFPFKTGSCLLAVPGWNKLAAKYYLRDKVAILSLEEFSPDNDFRLKKCSKIYVLDQISVDRSEVNWQLVKVRNMSYKLMPIKIYKNQVLYSLGKI